MTDPEILLGLPGYQITGMRRSQGEVWISVRHVGTISCPHCGGSRMRDKGRYARVVRHENLGLRHCRLLLEGRRLLCLECGRYFRQRFPGISRWQRASEAYQEMIFRDHLDGVNRSRLGRREKIGAATVERYFKRRLKRQFAEWHPPECPQALGIDEHFFTRRLGYATTLCDLKNHKVYDVVLGRSQLSLDPYFQRLEGHAKVRLVCMDLASNYRALVQKHFPNACIVADRFHVIRIISHHFLACWKEIDPVGSKNRGLLSLMRRHRHNLSPAQVEKLSAYLAVYPVLEPIYAFKQRLCYLLLERERTRKQCQQLIPRFLRSVYQLREAGLPQLVQLGNTLNAWSEEIVAMWRYTRSNGITEGFHNKMELISRQAYGFRNFENYRMRVKVLCS